LAWYDRFKWLEYSIEADSAFCYACRTFGHKRSGNEKDSAFVKSGFRSWKSAVGDSHKGFLLHEKSKIHIDSMVSWKDQIRRINSNKEISTLVNNEALEENRYYVSTLMEIAKFLAVEEISFRGDENCDGKFIHLFEFTRKRDARLNNITSSLPQNATYRSPTVQNEIIATLSSMVSEEIANQCKNADVPIFSVMVDGTRDKTRVENVAISLRFVKDGICKEHLLKMPVTEETNSTSITQVIKHTLEEHNLDIKNVVSQCYDGASNMSGHKNGVQKLIQDEAGKAIPYIHCYNHKLNLIVKDAVSSFTEFSTFFDYCETLYNFFLKSNIAKIYEGTKFKRLIPTRWSGHYNATKHILKNYDEILQCLEDVVNNKMFSAEIVIQAVGLKQVVLNKDFLFSAVFMDKILGILHPVEVVFQSKSVSFTDAVKIIKATKLNLEGISSNESLKEILEKVSKMQSDGGVQQHSAKRICIKANDSKRSTIQEYSFFFDALTLILMDFDVRFSDNIWLYNIMSAFDRENDHFFSLDKISPITSLGISLPTAEELKVAKTYLNSLSPTNETLLKSLYPVREAFPRVYNMVASVFSIPCSSSTCEASFSTLSRIDAPFRRSMSSNRKSDLTLLAYEKEMTANIQVDRFLRKFHDSHKRIQLF